MSAVSSSVVPGASVIAATAAAAMDNTMPQWAVSLMAAIRSAQSRQIFTRNKLLIAALLFGGSVFAYNQFYLAPKVKRASDMSGASSGASPPRPKVAVDRVFFSRLYHILRIVVPSLHSWEALYLVILSVLLVSRTALSIWIAELAGRNAQALVGRRWGAMFRGIAQFAVITIPASAVNAGLKYTTEMLSLRFRVRLSQSVNDSYLSGVNYYKAVNLGGASRIDSADQRVTADIKDWSDEISALYSSLLKPTLDVILFTYQLSNILGWQGPALMHSYFILSGFIKRELMPNFGRLVAVESELEGRYRTAHNRLITNSEEIAFYDGARREKQIINEQLRLIEQHVTHARFVKACVAFFDGLLVKYYASIAGYIVLLSPMLFDLPFQRGLTTADLTRDYIRNSQYLGNLSTAVGQLVIVGTKLNSIAGYTSRVSELLEQVQHLDEVGNEPFEVKADDVKAADLTDAAANEANDQFINKWRTLCDEQQKDRLEIRSRASTLTLSDGVTAQPTHSNTTTNAANGVHHLGGTIEIGEYIAFEHVDIVSPEGKLLVQDLTFTVPPGVNVMVTGPNGVGKSSLFRVIGELWPLQSGRLIKPPKAAILFVPQKPYLVMGTLRDQVIYPHTLEDCRALGITDEHLDSLLAIVDPAKNITREWTWDTVKDWFHAFSGGQKQRVAMARLFYHRPQYAILDECTSAVSDEVEDTLYLTCRKLNITLFTVSHRIALARHHDKMLRFEGHSKWSVVDVDKPQFKKELPRLVTSELARNTSTTTTTTTSTSAAATVPVNNTAAAAATTATIIPSNSSKTAVASTKASSSPSPVGKDVKVNGIKR